MERLNYIKNCITKTAVGTAIGVGTVVGVNAITGVVISSGLQLMVPVGAGVLGPVLIPVAIAGGVIGGGIELYKSLNKNKEIK